MAAQAAPTPQQVPPVTTTPVSGGSGALTRHKRTAGRVLRWVLLALAVAMLIRFMWHGWPEIRMSLSRLSGDQLPLVGVAVVVEALWMYAMSQVYRSALLAFGGAVRRGTALRISMAAFTVSRIVPGGGAAGGAVAARELIALGNPALPTIMSMLASWWITMTGLSALLVAGIGVSVLDGAVAARYLVAPGIALTAFVVGGVAISLAARNPRLRARISRAVANAVDRLAPGTAAGVDGESVTSTTSRIRGSGLLAVFGWGALVWITDAAALWLTLAMFGWQVDVGVLLIAFGVANLIGALPELTPGWLGVLETSVAVTLSAFGIPEGIAAVAVLVYRLLSYWLPTAAGIPAAAGVLGRRPRPSRRDARPAGALT